MSFSTVFYDTIIAEQFIIHEMKARYQYRVYPTDRQCKLLARLFGCVRVVYNDALALCRYDKVVKTHDYETKLEMMDLLPVTSIMTVEQMAEYLEAIYYKYTDAGVHLHRP